MIKHGHGPLRSILDTYTLEHVNHFLTEIALDGRRSFKETIIATRVANAEEKSYTRYMNHLKGQERVVEQRRTGRRFMTYEEQMKLESQRHVKFNEMSAEQQAKLQAERQSMWDQIPAHILAKSKKLAGH